MKGNVRLRQLREKDATHVYADWFRDPDIQRWITHGTPTVAACRTYIHQHRNRPWIRLWGIYLGRQHVGNIKAESHSDGRAATLGLLVGHHTMRGQGIGTAAILAAIRWCRRYWKTGYFLAGVHPDNAASIRAFSKAGFRLLMERRLP